VSTQDARLSPQERAALANLEAAAAAADPQFAARLRGSPLFRIKAAVPRLVALTVGQWRALLRHSWWGAPLTIFGFVLMILGLSTGLTIGVVGAMVSTCGLRLVVQAASESWARRRALEAEAGEP
jgi:Protein of unknown function (DUF3040)